MPDYSARSVASVGTEFAGGACSRAGGANSENVQVDQLGRRSVPLTVSVLQELLWLS